MKKTITLLILAFVNLFLWSSKTEAENIRGHEAVDLGLSVKWAQCNVGASRPWDNGNYYAWGETYTKGSYSPDNCDTYYKSFNDIKGTEYDIAQSSWGGTWRIPTKTEMEELRDKCDWTWSTEGGKQGWKVTGPNGNSIFLPAAGAGFPHGVVGEGSGNYSTSTPFRNNKDAYTLFFSDASRFVGVNSRHFGYTVRPVSK